MMKGGLLLLLWVTLVTIIIIGLKMVKGTSANAGSFPIARADCQDKCGNISIPFPFGIGDECYYNEGAHFKLRCNNSTNPPTLLKGGNIQVVDISMEGELRIYGHLSYVCYYNNNTLEPSAKHTAWVKMPTFTLSTTKNYIGAIGCDTFVWLNGMSIKNSREFRTGCMTVCAAKQDISNNNTCSGIGCCLASVPDGVNNIQWEVSSLNRQRDVQNFNPCSVGFVVAKDDAENNELPLSVIDLLTGQDTYYKKVKLPVVYGWSIGNKSCRDAQETKEYICQGNTTCYDQQDTSLGYTCQCNPGFQGNPYLYDCQDIDECTEGKHDCKNPAICVNTIGGYNCTCNQGYSYSNGTKDPCIADNVKGLSSNSTLNRKELLVIKIIGGVGGGVIVSLAVALWFHWQHGDRKLRKMRESFFHQNGGHILKQKLSRRDVSASMVEMFTDEELKKATKNYNDSSIIGRGGFGMVYKATLPNNKVVAIKRSLKVDSNQVEQFVNEIVALSQINNKNVVKLLGCCLETEVPLLVYEYISNGTLDAHLHDDRKAHFLTWDIRLRIATEVSDVLSYLHTTISIPIIHRDIKSANILLDENYTAKVADFGASKLAPVDREQLATMVQGTCGYLDPEYMQTGELTEKSDVYSFGVVLVELITGEKAICYAKPENERSLAVCFLRKLKEEKLFEIIDEKIRDGGFEQVKEVSYLAKRCLKLKGEDRPTMKEISRELERIRDIGRHPWSNNGIVVQEESEYLLGETQLAISHRYDDNEGVDHTMSNQSRVVQLVPLNDGR